MNYWRLCDEYSIMHAAQIVVGRYPEDIEGWNDDELERQAPGYVAVRTALCSAIESEAISTMRVIRLSGEYPCDNDPLDVRRTTISVTALDRFFKARGFPCEFFDRETTGVHQNGKSPFFSKKLDAANKAWAAVTSDAGLRAGKSPKQALEKWLTDNAANLGLLNKDGKPNRTGIEEICKVANWKPEGGATPTPSATDLSASAPAIRDSSHTRPSPEAVRDASYDLNDDIPF